MNYKLPRTERIAAIIPCYTAIGDNTKIIDTNGSIQTTSTRLSTVLNRLARSHATDLVALKQKVAGITDHTLLQPLPLAPGLVLCPMKLRPPKVPGDTSVGYINLHALLSVISNQQRPSQSIIKLIGGTELTALWKINTVKKHFQYGRLALAYTAHSPETPPEITIVSQRIAEVMYDLLSIYSLHSPSAQSLPTVLPK